MDKLSPILIAEDSENDIELILAALGENNLANRVVVVRNGAEALDYLHHRGSYASTASPAPVVVLLDIKMPKVSGIETLRLMKDDPALSKIPVVMLTSSREGPDIQECYRLGANAYVVKPLVFQEFFEAIKVMGHFWAVINEIPATIESRSRPTVQKDRPLTEP
jgi:CheY-like chemotaxis protein